MNTTQMLPPTTNTGKINTISAANMDGDARQKNLAGCQSVSLVNDPLVSGGSNDDDEDLLYDL